LQGPAIFTSGPKLEGYKSVWKGDIEIGTTAELHQALDSLQRLKADFVKITDNTLQPALYLESIREARKRGFAVSGHVPYAIPMKEIVDAGISSVEHITYLLKAGSSEEENISRQVANGELKGRALSEKVTNTWNKQSALAMYRYLAQHGTAVTPTLSLGYTLAYFDEHDPRNDAYLQYIGKGLQKTYEGRVNNILKHDAAAIANRKTAFERSAALLPLLQEAGVKILAGTDAGYLNSYTYPGLGLHTELALMVKYGLTPLQVLQASVINVPEFLGQKNYGAIAAGKKADIVLLNANPLKDITNTQKIDAVITRGQYLSRRQLDDLLKETAAKTAQGI
jgi:imidazolonepropionase-like amidohydrolase